MMTKGLMRRVGFYLLVIGAFLLLHLVPALASEPSGQAGGEEAVAATVNGVPIQENLLDADVKLQLEKYSRYGMRQATSELIATLRQQSLDRLIDQELLRQASSKMVVKDAEEQGRQKLTAMQAEFTSPERFEHYLTTRNLTPEKFIDNYRAKLQMDAYLASLGLTDIEPTEEQIASYYERGRENFKREESVKVRHILIAVPADSATEIREQARTKAEELRSKLVQDIHQFTQFAASFSGCARSKDQGGDLGYIKRGFMPPEFDAVAFSLSPGELGAVVPTKYGFHIIQLIDKRKADYAPLSEMHDFIKKFLQGDMEAKKKASHVKELRRQAAIQIFIN